MVETPGSLVERRPRNEGGVSRPHVLLIDHYDSYTYNLAHLIASVTGSLPSVVEHDRIGADAVEAFSHVVLSPGPGTPHSPTDFAVGREVLLAARRPVLGVCLGMQGMVATYGGRVEAVEPSHGVVASISHSGTGLFNGIPQGFDAVRYHSLAAVEVPDCLEVTAREASGVVMAVAHRELPQVGVQFHPESILSRHGAALIANFLELR